MKSLGFKGWVYERVGVETGCSLANSTGIKVQDCHIQQMNEKTTFRISHCTLQCAKPMLATGVLSIRPHESLSVHGLRLLFDLLNYNS